MAVPATSYDHGPRIQSSRSGICGKVLGTAVGLVLGSLLLVLMGMIASMDAFMPSNGIYRNVSHTNMGVLGTMMTLVVKNVADRYWNSAERVEDARTTDHNEFSLLLIRNRSLAFHEELRGQVGEQLSPGLGNGSIDVPTVEVPGVGLAVSQGFGSRNVSIKAVRKLRRKRKR
ncbi:uncharacterized protein LOC142817704 [Rhipicephalus microplus]|uniref:uncharacterized protein LOC142817704 n=1 Tax=Rhipicephalus microplus TaxID=6941 RepID=UPI002376B61B